MSGKDSLYAFRLLADFFFPGDPLKKGVAFCFSTNFVKGTR